MRYSDNFDAFKGQFRHIASGHARQHRMLTATISNFARHAVHLNNREGFFLFNDELLQKILRASLVQLEQVPGALMDPARVRKAAEKGIVTYINTLRALAGTAPPFRKGTPPRRAHIGKWADITGYTNNAYRYRFDNGEWQSTEEWKAGLVAAKARFAELYPNSTRQP